MGHEAPELIHFRNLVAFLSFLSTGADSKRKGKEALEENSVSVFSPKKSKILKWEIVTLKLVQLKEQLPIAKHSGKIISSHF